VEIKAQEQVIAMMKQVRAVVESGEGSRREGSGIRKGDSEVYSRQASSTMQHKKQMDKSFQQTIVELMSCCDEPRA